LAWTIEYSDRADHDLARLDRQVARRIVDFMDSRIAASANPRATGAALSGDQKGLWRYRVGDYRVICDIRDAVVVVLVLRIGHRRQVYR